MHTAPSTSTDSSRASGRGAFAGAITAVVVMVVDLVVAGAILGSVGLAQSAGTAVSPGAVFFGAAMMLGLCVVGSPIALALGAAVGALLGPVFLTTSQARTRGLTVALTSSPALLAVWVAATDSVEHDLGYALPLLTALIALVLTIGVGLAAEHALRNDLHRARSLAF